MKIRIIPTILVRNFGVVKTVKFDLYRPLGAPTNFARVYNSRGVDELVVLDIDATSEGRGPDLEAIYDIAEECFMPLTVGGGIRSVEDVQKVLQAGADKVAVNTAALENPHLITEIAKEFGSQCVVVSIDCLKTPAGYRIYTRGGKQSIDAVPQEWVKRAEDLGAGEILINSMDRDGTMTGYDLELCSLISSTVRIPVIASGGAGCLDHFLDVVKFGKVAAVSCASIFHYTQVTPQSIKDHLTSAGINVRLIE